MGQSTGIRREASQSVIQVAALFVETNGVYFGLDAVDPWDECRDARTYGGPSQLWRILRAHVGAGIGSAALPQRLVW